MLNREFVFLDFGGTLAYTTNTREKAIVASLAALDHSFTPEQVVPAVATARERFAGRSPGGLTYPQRQEFFIGLYQVVAEALGFGADARKVAEHLWETQQDHYELYPDTMPGLQALRAQGLRLGIISNWDKLNLAVVCRSLGIAAFFDVILPSAEAGADKPDPRIFRRAFELAQVEPELSAHVGDSYSADVQGARGVGIAGILVQREGDLEFDCPTVRGLDEVPDLLGRL